MNFNSVFYIKYKCIFVCSLWGKIEICVSKHFIRANLRRKKMTESNTTGTPKHHHIICIYNINTISKQSV